MANQRIALGINLRQNKNDKTSAFGKYDHRCINGFRRFFEPTAIIRVTTSASKI